MEDVTSKDSLELEVNDFGPIVDARIDLRPLTVFVGPSNTGKSYLAILIYALHRYHSDFLYRRDRIFGDQFDLELPPGTFGVLDKWAKPIFAGKTLRSIEHSLLPPASVLEIARSAFDLQGDALGRVIARTFGVNSPGTLVRKESRRSANVVLRKRSSEESKRLDHRLTIGTRRIELLTTTPESHQVSISGNDRLVFALAYRKGLDRESRNWYGRQMLETLMQLVLPRLFGPLHIPAFYLPADRTGVMHSHQVVVSSLIENAATATLRRPVNTPMLSGVLADFLQQLIQLEPGSYRESMSSDDLSMQIEEAILSGSVQIESPEGFNYPHFTYRPIGWKKSLPLMNASSMVSEIAPVVLYLRHLVSLGNVLIIEEPESHLHPAMQVEFTRQLAALVQAGVRVIITTHSEWVLEELANIVRRSELSKSRRKKMPHGEFALRPEQVGAWLFKQKRRPKGSVVEEIRFDPDAGGLESDFDEVGRQLYNDWATIGSRIAGSTE